MCEGNARFKRKRDLKHSMLIGYGSHEEPLKKYFNHYFHKVKVGLITTMTGSPFLKTGTGKSYSAMRIGEMCDKNFGIHKVVYTPTQFLEAIDRIEENPYPGQVLVVDEGEVTANAHEWQNFSNKAISLSLATFRYLRCMAIFVTPSFSWIDKRIRQLTNHVCYSEKKVGSDQKPYVDLRMYRLLNDDSTEKVYRQKITMYNSTEKRIVTFKSFRVSMPSDVLCERYERKALAFKQQLRDSFLKETEAVEVRKQQKLEPKVKRNAKSLLDDALKNEVIKKSWELNGTVTNNTLRNVFDDLSYNEASRLKSLLAMKWDEGEV